MAKTTYSREELESQLSESRREFWAADATINNLEMKLAEMAERLANAESKLESAEKLIDTLRQDKDKVIDMSIERVNKLLSRAEAAEKRITEQESVHDERAAFETFMEERFKDLIDRRLVKNGDGEYFAWDMQVAWIVWQGRAAMLHRFEAETDTTNQQFESLSRGDK